MIAMKICKKIFLILIVCLTASAAPASLSGRINSIINRPDQQKVSYSVKVVNAQTGKEVYSHNDQHALIPASNMKVIATAAALHYLGKDFQFITKVGFCQDTLVIIGGGDPLFGDDAINEKYNRDPDWPLNDIVAKVKAAGIKRIENMIVDTSVFDNHRVHDNWLENDLNRPYACEVAGMNYNGNCIKIQTAASGGRVRVRTLPNTDFVNIVNKAKAISTGRGTVGSYRNGSPNHITVFGKVRGSMAPFEVAIEKPAAFFSYILAEHLVQEHIAVCGQMVERAITEQDNFKLLVSYSTDIADVLERANTDSFGLAAESLAKMIAAKASKNGKGGSWPKASQLTEQYLLALGVSSKQYRIDDASGLSRENRLSANALTAVLLDVYKSKNRDFYFNTLAVGGESGTMAGRFRHDKYKGKALIKSGYMKGIRSYSGLCKTAGGDYIFSVITNNGNGMKTRHAINDVVKAIIDEYD